MNDVIMIMIVMVCAFTDMRYRKIYNAVIGPGLLFALIANFALGGWQGLVQSLAGFAAGLALLLIPFILGGIGAGDVKLLALVGTFKGAGFVFYAFLCTALIGGLMAILLIILRKGSSQVGRSLLATFYSIFSLMKFRIISIGTDRANTLPYGVAIALGTLSAYWVR